MEDHELDDKKTRLVKTGWVIVFAVISVFLAWLFWFFNKLSFICLLPKYCH